MDAVLIVIFLFLLPILIMGFFEIIKDRHKRLVKRILENALNQLTTENDLLIVDVEYLNNKVIGIDRKNRKLVYADYRKGTIHKFCIHLSFLSFCRVNKVIDESSNSLKSVFIEVKCKDINKTIRLNFYDRSFDNIRSKAILLRKAEQWKNKINLHRRSLNFNKELEYVCNVE